MYSFTINKNEVPRNRAGPLIEAGLGIIIGEREREREEREREKGGREREREKERERERSMASPSVATVLGIVIAS